jgi:hypothetical protein
MVSVGYFYIKNIGKYRVQDSVIWGRKGKKRGREKEENVKDKEKRKITNDKGKIEVKKVK